MGFLKDSVKSLRQNVLTIALVSGGVVLSLDPITAPVGLTLLGGTAVKKLLGK